MPVLHLELNVTLPENFHYNSNVLVLLCTIILQPKLIYVVRNPKSVAVSYHSYTVRGKSAEYEGTFNGFFPVFMKGLCKCDLSLSYVKY